ncbi:MAG: hypothetical protein AAGE86_00765 [Pseudomonadota bacterium]
MADAPDRVTEADEAIEADPTALLRMIAIGVLAVVLVIAVISNLGSGSSQRSYEADKLVIEWAAKDKVRAVIRDPDSAQFSGIIAKPFSEEGKGIVCGRVQSRNGFGGMSLPQRFIVTDTIFMIEEQAAPEQFSLNWGILCKPS